jgi:FlaA1/EpsC-like NDP-sugar epimerase
VVRGQGEKTETGGLEMSQAAVRTTIFSSPAWRRLNRRLEKLYGLRARRRRSLLAVGDAAAWIAGLAFGAALQYDLSMHIPNYAHLALTAGVAAGAQICLGLVTGLYRGRWRFASFEGVGALAVICFVIVAALLMLNLSDGHLVPESVPIIGGDAALALMLIGRYVARLTMDHLRKPGEAARRLIIFGAGHAGQEVVSMMLHDPDSPYLPVAMLDDDLERKHRSIQGIPVVGTRYDMAKAKERFEAKTLLIAVRRGATSTLHRELADLAAEAGLTVKVLPSLREVIEATKKPYEIRQATIEDVLGRREIRTDLSAAASYLAGRSVLVTGAGGSIGSELCRQIQRFGPAELIMLDRDESALHGLQLSLEGHALLDSPDLVLMDIRDRRGLDALFTARRPEVVFHAAALKHQPVLELHPGEAVQTNIWGTLNVLEAAIRHGVDRFVNISTDKAAAACSVLGYSKRITERLTASARASCPDGTFLSVRFGNVLGSRGSVLHTFREQIVARVPITVTHPEVRRFFMTVEEAIQLVIQAGAVGSSSEVLVLDMGEPVRIEEVARRMIAEAGETIEITYTGLRPGEKLVEVLFSDDESGSRFHHPMITHVEVPPLHPGRVTGLDPFAPPELLVARLRMLSRSMGVRGGDEDLHLAQSWHELDITTPVEHPAALRWNSPSRHRLPASFGSRSGHNNAASHRCERHRRSGDWEASLSCPECALPPGRHPSTDGRRTTLLTNGNGNGSRAYEWMGDLAQNM